MHSKEDVILKQYIGQEGLGIANIIILLMLEIPYDEFEDMQLLAISFEL